MPAVIELQCECGIDRAFTFHADGSVKWWKRQCSGQCHFHFESYRPGMAYTKPGYWMLRVFDFAGALIRGGRERLQDLDGAIGAFREMTETKDESIRAG